MRWIYANLPQQTRLNIATKIRQKSQQGNKNKTYDIMDVEPNAVLSLLAKTNCQSMIHGHTHRPAIHDINQGMYRVVVGDWYTQGSVLFVDTNGYDLQKLPFKNSID